MTGSTVTPASEWAPASDVATLPSGRNARLRSSLPVYLLLRSGVLDKSTYAALARAQKGELDDPELASKLMDIICSSMFIEPKVGPEEGCIPFDALTDEDVDFVVERAFGGAPDDGFPGHADGDGNRKSGAGVEKPAKSNAGASSGNARRARSRSTAS